MDPVYTGPTLSRSRACCRPSGRVLACRRGRAPAEHNAQSQLSQSGLPCYPNTNAVQILHLQQCCRPLLAASRRTAKDLCGSGWFPRPAAWASDGFRARCAPTPAAHPPAPCPARISTRGRRSAPPRPQRWRALRGGIVRQPPRSSTLPRAMSPRAHALCHCGTAAPHLGGGPSWG